MEAPPPKRGLPRGLIPSLLLHSLPLLALIGWRPAPVESPTPIPIELVIERPPPAPALPAPPVKPPRVRSASDDFAEAPAPKPEQGTDSAPPIPAEPPPAAEPKTAAAEPATPPKPAPAEEPQKTAANEPQPAAAEPPVPPEPAPSEEPTPPAAAETKIAALPPPLPPKPAPHTQQPKLPRPVPLASAWPLPLRQEHDQPRQQRRFAALAGPDAVRDEYCVRALNLTLRHLDLLPLAYLGGRRGRTVVTIRILGDGIVNSVKLAESSGYPDIDQRIERMVFAVGQYPPLPPRMPGLWMDFSFVMVFPDALQQ